MTRYKSNKYIKDRNANVNTITIYGKIVPDMLQKNTIQNHVDSFRTSRLVIVFVILLLSAVTSEPHFVQTRFVLKFILYFCTLAKDA